MREDAAGGSWFSTCLVVRVQEWGGKRVVSRLLDCRRPSSVSRAGSGELERYAVVVTDGSCGAGGLGLPPGEIDPFIVA